MSIAEERLRRALMGTRSRWASARMQPRSAVRELQWPRVDVGEDTAVEHAAKEQRFEFSIWGGHFVI